MRPAKDWTVGFPGGGLRETVPKTACFNSVCTAVIQQGRAEGSQCVFCTSGQSLRLQKDVLLFNSDVNYKHQCFHTILNRDTKTRRNSCPLPLTALSVPGILAPSRTFHMYPGKVLDTLLSIVGLKCYGFCGVFSHWAGWSRCCLAWASQLGAAVSLAPMSNAGSISTDLLLTLPLITCSASRVGEQRVLLS